MNRRENPPTFKVGQVVCFQFSEKKEAGKQYWNIGTVISLPVRKDNEAQVVEIRAYEIAESFRSRESEEQWACLDPLRIDFTREMFILNSLDARTRGVMKESSGVIRVPVTDLCPATYHRFRRALTEGKVVSLNGKESFW